MIGVSWRRGLVVAGVALLVAWFWSGDMRGQTRPAPGPFIRSVAEPSQQLDVKATSRRTGLVTFASTPDQGILVERATSVTPEARALDFVDLYGQAFGLTGRADVAVARTSRPDAAGLEHVRLQQMHRGIPVAGSQLIVHLKGARVHAANGEMLTDLPADTTPTVDPAAALALARTLVTKGYPGTAAALLTAPRLEVFNRGVFEHRSAPSHLAWFVEARGRSFRELVWIDAHTGVLLLHFNQQPHAKSRQVFTANNGATLPGTLLRSEGGPPSGNADADLVYNMLDVVYDYFLGTHGRDSYDGAGATMRASTQVNDGCPNAFWSSGDQQWGFCAGIVADDVVGHEFTHAITEHTANLFNFSQSGALNESFSDIFGETIDLLDATSGGNDSPAQRWLISEDLPAEFLRNMMTPTALGHPGKMSDSQFVCDVSDNAGIHTNSGVPNHAYALMVDGGTFNAYTVAGIGLTKAAKVQYQALTGYLTPNSSFQDLFYALNQSCSDLLGSDGITVSDCVQVTNALLAVEMNATFACNQTRVAPSACPAGGVPVPVFQNSFETFPQPWSMQQTSSTSWTFLGEFASDGTNSAWGFNPPAVSDHSLFMTTPVLVPAGGRMTFDHSFEFEAAGASAFDGGVIEFSTNGGGLWSDAGAMIDAGRKYRGTIATGLGNPLQGRSAFTRDTLGYASTRLNLASLAGQNVQFRFRVGTDGTVSAPGWFVDDVAVYSCAVTAGAPAIAAGPVAQTRQAGGTAVFTVTANGNAVLKFRWLKNGVAIPGATTDTLTLTNVQDADNGQYSVIVSNDVGTATSDGAPLTVIGAGTWSGTTNLGRPHNFVVDGTAANLTALTYSAAFACTTVTSTVNSTIPIDPATGSFSFDNGVNTCGTRVQTSGTFTGSGTATGTATITLSNSSFMCPVPCNGVRQVTWTAALGGPAIVTQPRSRTVASGTTLQFAVDATGTPAPTFQWHVSSDGVNFNPLSNGAPYSGVTTDTLIVTGATVGLNGLVYRAVATNASGSATSDHATLGVTGTQFVQNGDFSNGTTGWFPFGQISFGVVGGVFEYFRTAAGQALVAQHTGVGVGANTGLSSQFDLGNSSSVRKRITVIMLNSDFADQSVCTFFLEPFAPMRTYQIRMHTTQAWNDAAIYFYAASLGANGGNYQLDNVSMQVDPGASPIRTDCVDPTTPAAPGGATGANLFTNGDFSNGTSSWFISGQISHQVSQGVFEFFRPAGTPAGFILQASFTPVSAGEIFTTVFDLGNSSALRRRITVIVHDLNFTDQQVCTFFLAPGQPLSTYEIRTHMTKASTEIAVSFYPANIGNEQWYRLDNVALHRTPGAPTLGSECMEPGGVLPPAFRMSGSQTGANGGSPSPDTTAPADPSRAASGEFALTEDAGRLVWRASASSTGPQFLAWPRVIDLSSAGDTRMQFRSKLSARASTAEVQVARADGVWQTVSQVPGGDVWLDVDVDLGAFAGSVLQARLVFNAVMPVPGHEMDVWLVDLGDRLRQAAASTRPASSAPPFLDPAASGTRRRRIRRAP